MKNKQKNLARAYRPPIVVVLGHVDHGKTSLLDRIRKTNVAGKEAGGITQNIGAFQAVYDGKSITFIDTPGHAAFAKMRSQGAQVADMAILVIAADEGLKPQTLESLKFIREAGIDFIVAINKVDLPAVNVEQVKNKLVESGVELEDVGGNVVALPVSAKTGQGVGDLLEMIVLIAEMKDLGANSAGPAEGVIIESRFDKRRGSLATVVLRRGRLFVGDKISVGGSVIKIKALFDEGGQNVGSIGPGQAAEIFGLESLPVVGAKVFADGMTEGSIEPKSPLPEKKMAIEKNKVLIIIKADTKGTLEAILGSLPPEVVVMLSGVGDVSESDVLSAKDYSAIIFAFRVDASSVVKKLIETEKIPFFSHKIIYEFLEELDRQIFKWLNPELKTEISGKAEILKEFGSGKERIAGCRVLEGEIKKGEIVSLVRGEKTMGTGRIKSMKIMKSAVDKAKVDQEFGAIFSPPLDFFAGDMLVSARR